MTTTHAATTNEAHEPLPESLERAYPPTRHGNALSQNAVLSAMWRAGGVAGARPHLLRIDIRKDTSYDWQSHARVARWDGERWQEVASLDWRDMHYQRRALPHGQGHAWYDRQLDDALYADERELLRRAAVVLGLV